MPEAAWGLLGVVVGALLQPIVEWIKHIRTRSREKHYLAARVSIVLDRFIEGCKSGISFAEMRDAPSYISVDFSSLDVNWHRIDGDLLFKVLDFPNGVEQTNLDIKEEADLVGSHHYPHITELYIFKYSQLALAAIALSEAIRKEGSLPTKDRSKEKEWMERVISEYFAKQKELQQKQLQQIARTKQPSKTIDDGDGTE